ncbi:MAG TPA: YncE family protein [Gemmatimonadales bacterium]|nr:YncE family protein [Gemmatimonadales bacterium]
MALVQSTAPRDQSTAPAGGPHRLPICGNPFGIAVGRPDLAYVTRTRAATVERLDLRTLQFRGGVQLGCTPTCVKFDASGERAYVTVQYCDEIAVIDARRDVQIHAFPVPGNPFPLALSPAGRTLFVTTNEDRLFGLNVQNGRLVGSLPLPATSHHLALHPSGGRLYVATRTGGSVLEVDTSRYEVIRAFALGGWPQGLAVSRDGTTLYVANERHGLDVVRLASGKRIGVLDLEGGSGNGAVSLALSPNDGVLYAGLVHSGRIAAIDVASLTLRAMINTGGRPREIAFDQTGKVLIANEAGWVDILPSDGRRMHQLDQAPLQSNSQAAASAS